MSDLMGWSIVGFAITALLYGLFLFGSYERTGYRGRGRIPAGWWLLRMEVEGSLRRWVARQRLKDQEWKNRDKGGTNINEPKLVYGTDMAYLAEHFGLDPGTVHRMVITCEVGQPVLIETEGFATGGESALEPHRYHLVKVAEEEEA